MSIGDILNSITGGLEKIEHEDEKWRKEFEIFEKDEMEAEQIRKEAERLRNYPIEENPENFCVEVLAFIDSEAAEEATGKKAFNHDAQDVVGYLKDVLREVSTLQAEIKQEERESQVPGDKYNMAIERADEAEKLIVAAEELLEKISEMVHPGSNHSIEKDLAVNVRSFETAFELEHNELGELKSRFDELEGKLR